MEKTEIQSLQEAINELMAREGNSDKVKQLQLALDTKVRMRNKRNLRKAKQKATKKRALDALKESWDEKRQRKDGGPGDQDPDSASVFIESRKRNWAGTSMSSWTSFGPRTRR